MVKYLPVAPGKDVGFSEDVQNFSWVDDNSVVVYASKSIYWVALGTDEVVKISDVMITQKYGIEVLIQ
jgi:hypothetical protein